MIEIEKLFVKNFRRVGNSGIHFDFSELPNTTLVYSKLNGSGKTTLFVHAVIYALKGKAYNDGSKLPNLVNTRNKKSLYTKLSLTSNGVPVTIERGIKPNIFELEIDGIKVDAGLDLQAELDKVIGNISFKNLVNNLILSTSRYKPFRQLTKGEREGFIDELIGTNVIPLMLSFMKKDVSKTQSDVEMLEKEISVYMNTFENLNQHFKSFNTNNSKMLDALSDEVFSLSEQHKKTSDKFNELKVAETDISKRLASATSNFGMINSAFIEAESRYSKCTSELNQIHKLVHEGSVCPLCNSTIADNNKDENILKYENVKKDCEKYLTLRNSISDKKSEYESVYKVVSSEYNHIQSLLTQTSFELSQVYSMLSSRALALKDAKKSADSNTDCIASDIRKLEHDIDVCKVKLSSSIYELNVYKDALMFMTKNDVRRHIFEMYLPQINSLINKYLDGMEFFINVELKSNYTIEVSTNSNKNLMIQDLSDGEQTKIDLAFILVWKTITLMMYKTDINLFVLDETISKFSPQSVTEFIKLVKRVLPDHKIISILQHPNDFVELFDCVVEIGLENGYTVINSIE